MLSNEELKQLNVEYTTKRTSESGLAMIIRAEIYSRMEEV